MTVRIGLSNPRINEPSDYWYITFTTTMLQLFYFVQACVCQLNKRVFSLFADHSRKNTRVIMTSVDIRYCHWWESHRPVRMASSSLSQESLDHEEVVVDISARRSRVRGGRSRCAAGFQQRVEATDESRDVEIADDRSHRSAVWPPHRSAATSGAAGPPLPGHVNFYATTGGDHESPNRMRIKDKRSWQPGYLHKNKPPAPPSKDKRKLREKRRSSGLVHAQSAEV